MPHADAGLAEGVIVGPVKALVVVAVAGDTQIHAVLARPRRYLSVAC